MQQHEAICDFPSKHFYDGRLKTALSVKKRNNPETKLDVFWPGPKKSDCPILFCNIIGKEEDYKAGCITAEEKMNIGIDLKFNQTEAKKVVRDTLF